MHPARLHWLDACALAQVLCGPVGGPFWDVEFMHGHGQFSNR
jgi:hypothetical protein